MSNFLAPATVTATLQELIRRAIATAMPGALVTAAPPTARGDRAGPPRVNVFLYQVALNGDLRNLELPVRRRDGAGVSSPTMAVDLRYLLSFYGDEASLEPQRLLGATVAALHATPLLTRDLVRGVIEAATTGDPHHPLASSDLADQPVPVRLTPVVLSIEEHARMWSNLFQIPYVLSVPYIASVVLLESTIDLVPAPPATRLGLSVGPAEPLRIDAVGFDEEWVAAPRGAVVLRGRFGSEPLLVQLDGERLSHQADGETLRLRLPADTRPGPHALAVTRADGRGSAGVELLVHPRLRGLNLAEGRIQAEVEPPVGGPAELTLLPTFAGGQSRVLQSDDGVNFDASGLEPGKYLARLRVGELESPLRLSASGRPTGPVLRVP